MSGEWRKGGQSKRRLLPNALSQSKQPCSKQKTKKGMKNVWEISSPWETSLKVDRSEKKANKEGREEEFSRFMENVRRTYTALLCNAGTVI
ncbi:hypothetical protein BDR22DRAFT_171346 [Usnea florida]